MDHDSVKTRYNLAKTRRQAVESEISDAYLYTSPAQDPMRVGDSVPDRDKIYDATAEDSINTLVNNINSYLLPQDQRWAVLSLSEATKTAMGGATATWDIQLETETKKLYDALNGSNFYLSSSEGLKDMAISGTGCVGLELTDYGIHYQAIPVAQLYYLDSSDCIGIDTVFRCNPLPARTVIAKWSKRGTIPAWVTELAKDKPEEQVEVVEVMIPGKRRGTFSYLVYTSNNWEPILEQTVAFAPFIVFRWDRTAGTTWGDSPIRKALPQIKVTNRLVMDILDDSGFAARGAWSTTDEALRDQVLTAGTILFTNDELKPVQFPGQFSINVNLLQDARQQIRQMLMADSLPTSDRMTREEIVARQQQFFRRIGTAALRIEEEFLEPILYNTIKALQSVGRMSKYGIDDDPVRIETRSLVKRVQAMRQIEDVMQLVAAVGQLGPTGTMHIDMPKLGRFILETGGFPAQLLKPEDQVAQEIQAMQLAQAAGGLMAAQGGQSNPESTKSTGEAVAGLMSQIQQAA